MIDIESLARRQIKAKYEFFSERGAGGEWMAVIFETGGISADKCLTVGIELSRKAIKKWISLALENRPWEEDGIETPDHYDRNGLVRDHSHRLH